MSNKPHSDNSQDTPKPFPEHTRSFAKTLAIKAEEVLIEGPDGIKLQAFVKGTGPVIVYHPGSGRWAKDFDRIGDYVADAGFRVISINPRGVGKSVGPMDEQSYPARESGKRAPGE